MAPDDEAAVEGTYSIVQGDIVSTDDPSKPRFALAKGQKDSFTSTGERVVVRCLLDKSSIILESRHKHYASPLVLKDGCICREIVISLHGLDRLSGYGDTGVNPDFPDRAPREDCEVTFVTYDYHDSPDSYDTVLSRPVAISRDTSASVTGFVRDEVISTRQQTGFTSNLAGADFWSILRHTNGQNLPDRSARSISVQITSNLLRDEHNHRWRTMDWDPARFIVLGDDDPDADLTILRPSTNAVKTEDTAQGSLTYFVPSTTGSDY
jgi:hypothetical protein